MAAQRAGLLKIPAHVRDVPDDRLLELALIENIQREQLNPIEEAQAYQNLIGDSQLRHRKSWPSRWGRNAAPSPTPCAC